MATDPADPRTPDGRYILVAGRLLRTSDPSLPETKRTSLISELMEARRAVKAAKRGNRSLPAARAQVEAAKVALGERGPPWWSDGAPDFNRCLAKNTPYAEWAAALGEDRGVRAKG